MKEVNITDRLLKLEHKVRKDVGLEQSSFLNLLASEDFGKAELDMADLKLGVITNQYNKLKFLQDMKSPNKKEKQDEKDV